MSGVVLGQRFAIQERIGVGGMASVHLCKDLALEGLAAVKLLRGSNADARRRFADEARLLANLRHPHLVQVLAVGETDDGAPYMVLEYIPGRSLDERLRQAGPLPWREVVELAGQVAGALGTLHQAGVIHRDVKPSNIVQLSTATGRPVAKLIDLGVAKVHGWEMVQAAGFTPAVRHQTDVGKVVGTPGFYPPEVSLSRADPRFDIYALGVTIYQLCTGVMPDPGELRRMIEVAPGCAVPPELEALVAAAVAVLPEDRIASADEFQRRLEAIRTTHTEETEPFLFDGCYELLELLGVGAKAEVYRAYHRDAARYVALKLLGDRARLSFEERLRFAREARVLAAARHPSLPRLIDCRTSTKRKRPYIAMTLVKGKRAGEFCIARHTLAPGDVIAVGKQLVGALATLHERGILHRDLNSSNVLIDLGRKTTATLIDAGMADLTDRFYAVVKQRYPTPPEARLKLGTGGLELLDWSAPEVRAGQGWTAKSDIYSLGLLLYRLLTGKRPFVGASTEMVSPRGIVPGCPAALETALRWALDHDPVDRVDSLGLLAQLDEASEEMNEESNMGGSGVGEEPAQATAAVLAMPQAGVIAAIPDVIVAVPPAAASRLDPVEAPRPWRPVQRALAVVLAGAVLMLGWWGGRVTAPSPASVATVATESGATGLQIIPEQPPMAVVVSPPPVVAVTLPPVREALDSVAGELGRCATLADEMIFVEFKTGKDHDRFTEVNLIGAHDDAVRRCVGDASARVRFEPTSPQSFTKDYAP